MPGKAIFASSGENHFLPLAPLQGFHPELSAQFILAKDPKFDLEALLPPRTNTLFWRGTVHFSNREHNVRQKVFELYANRSGYIIENQSGNGRNWREYSLNYSASVFCLAPSGAR